MTARPATVRIRRYLLVSLIGVAAALVGLYLFGRQGTAPEPEDAPKPSGAPDRPDVVASSDAFDFTQTIEGQPVFSIHGDSFTSGRDARVELTGVRLEIFREGRRYAVASKSATYDPNTKEAHLIGGATLEGADGLKLRSEELSLVKGGEGLESTGKVEFEQAGKFTGDAGSLAFDVPSDVLRLAGPVSLRSASGEMKFESERLELDRRGRVLRIPGVMVVTRGADRMQAGEGELFFSETADAPQLLALRGGVAGTIAQPAEGAPGRHLVVQATRLSLRFSGDSAALPEEATLEGRGRDLALVESVGDSADLIQGLASRAWVIRFAGGLTREAESTDPVHFAEYRRGVDEPVRNGRSDSGRIEFTPAGEVERLALVGGVELSDPAFKAWGDRALFDVATGRAEILGPKARIESPRADLAAPHFVYVRQTGILTATEGVRATLKRGAQEGLSALGWSGDQPVQVEAKEATLTDRPRTFAFRDDVRAWQGKNRVQAAQLRGSEEERQLSAAGGVKTVFIPEDGGSPVEITAATLSYDEATQRVAYAGNVSLLQEGRTLSCDKLDAELGDDKKIQRMTGSGHLALRDPSRGQEIQGATALYEVAGSTLLVEGSPVTLKDAQGAVLTGKRLQYDMKSGAAKLMGAAS